MSEQPTVPHRTPGIPMRALRVEVVAGPDRGRFVDAESETISVGTAADNGLVLTDTTVSRYHLELRHVGDRILVVDLGSTNGTATSGVLIERGRIAPGTRLEIGKTAIEVKEGGSLEAPLFSDDRLGGVRGKTPAMRRLMARIERVALSDASVLLLGETGSGKEVIARAIHEASPRKNRPLETVDCGAIAPALIASELFGHERGAFTGADRQHTGAFERAHGGTLFLDEIGELPVSLQSALLGALERRSFRRVGGNKPIEVDVRVVSATNRDLRADVNAGTFRGDLYYRLAVVALAIPALRERADDIPLLAEHFLREAGQDGPIEDVLPPKVMKRLIEHRWPGNVRELRNFVEATLAMGEAPELEGGGARASELDGADLHFPDGLFRVAYKDARERVLGSFEARYLKTVLEEEEGNVSGAARRAKIHRSYLIEMLKRHGLR